MTAGVGVSCSPAVSDGPCEAACACRTIRERHSSANSKVVSGTGGAIRPGGRVLLLLLLETNKRTRVTRERVTRWFGWFSVLGWRRVVLPSLSAKQLVKSASAFLSAFRLLPRLEEVYLGTRYSKWRQQQLPRSSFSGLDISLMDRWASTRLDSCYSAVWLEQELAALQLGRPWPYSQQFD